ncbi:MAG: hypothetical protein KC731_15125 [Myxococcales bacterium]|nr:hypothetical protein [Myxococcales bacterium]
MKHHQITAAIVLAAALGTSAAYAATLVPGLTYTGISGFSGTTTTAIGAASDEHAVSFLSAGERFNHPCELGVYKANIDGSNDSIYDEWDSCTTTSPNETIGWTTGSGIYVRGIAACTNNSANHRVKGIQIFGASIAANGTVTPLGVDDWFSRANCATWHAPVFCPAGQIATKVRVHRTGDEINGLSLACRDVAP